MFSWIIGDVARDWEYYESVFEDYPNASVYVDSQNRVEIVKVSDIGEYYGVGTVLLHWGREPRLRPWFVKMERYVAIPTCIEEVYKELVRKRGLYGIANYGPDFEGGFAVYECVNCKEKQRKHFEIFFAESEMDPKEVVRRHLELMGYNS